MLVEKLDVNRVVVRTTVAGTLVLIILYLEVRNLLIKFLGIHLDA